MKTFFISSALCYMNHTVQINNCVFELLIIHNLLNAG